MHVKSVWQVTLEFSQNDNAPVNLAEIRFHIPSSELAGDVDPAEAFKGDLFSMKYGRDWVQSLL